MSELALKLIAENKRTKAKSLDLGNCGLTEIPEEVFECVWLEELNFSETFPTLNHGICSSINMVSTNKLSKIPVGISKLINLKILILNGLYQYKGWTINTIEHLPNSIEQLLISDNEISVIKNLPPKLNILDIRRNNINSISSLIPLIKNETTINTYWHATIGKNTIFTLGNPINDPPSSIIQKGNAAILEYFRQKEKTGEKLLLEAKLILLGDGRAGKTSLANRLLKKDLPEEKDRTEGVDIIIGEYTFPLNNGEEFKLNIWDFAGQDKYKPLHQFFYTESSLYVMVADSGNPKTDYDDWMQTADLFGEGSPMLLVLNEFNENTGRGNFDEGHWKKQFPKLLKEVFDVNLGTLRGFDDLEKHIQTWAQTLPHTKYTFPTNWADIRSELESMRDRPHIRLEEYFAICEKNNLPEEESALILSSVLHKIGVCLHYQNNPLLEQFIILKNEWATEAVYKILKDKKVGQEKCGFFDQEDLERIWSHKDFRLMRPQLLELMRQFKMAYPLPGEKEFITPPLLPPARPPKHEWPENDSLELYIEYEFLPKALLTQFIVSRHMDIDEGRTLVWRNGVVLRWPEEALAEVSRTKLEGKDAFYIRTQGRNRKEMMTVILNTFRSLHEEYKGIKIKEKVPCNCSGCTSKKNKQHYYDYRNLKKRLEHNRPLDCDESFEEINIVQLLENHFIFERIQTGQPLELKEKVEYTEPPKEKTIKLFLASSNELKEEREKIEIAINRKNGNLRKQNIFIDLMVWEDGKFIGNSFRSQDNYNLEIDECHYFVLLFYSKVGKFSKEEYERAKNRFEKEGSPRLRVYQKDIDLPSKISRNAMNSRFDFIEELNEAGHFPELYENIEGLVHSLENSLDKLLEDEGFMGRLDN